MSWQGKLKLEIAAFHEILSLLSEEELEDLKGRKRAGAITGLDATVLDLLDRAIQARRIAKSLKGDNQ
jgi:hypothetical protein